MHQSADKPNGSWSPKEEWIPLIPCTSMTMFHCLKKLCHVYVNTLCIYTSYFVAVDMRGMWIYNHNILSIYIYIYMMRYVRNYMNRFHICVCVLLLYR